MKIVDAFALPLFLRVWSAKKAEDPNLSPMADNPISRAIYKVWDLLCFICERNTSPNFGKLQVTFPAKCKGPLAFISFCVEFQSFSDGWIVNLVRVYKDSRRVGSFQHKAPSS